MVSHSVSRMALIVSIIFDLSNALQKFLIPHSKMELKDFSEGLWALKKGQWRAEISALAQQQKKIVFSNNFDHTRILWFRVGILSLF